ncbi:GntR family transcriptional regulator [Paraburkholderia phenoliruptrix]|uniref:GntR family transcriptional regulator n=1 Tax=Paraburkholderia phenoliruptrix TaxID=252970 RepID=UPI002869B232|nr:GntR family transcriptional regulator [Paraburkholderia phenoliruptrix]WMY11779.1 GntR family transcriptional regulator [Paraburkholderia phenoliruptrix]
MGFETSSAEVAPRSDENAGASVRMADQAYGLMRRRILDNEWPPGYQATEQEAADQMGMSRTPIREAFHRLQQEGLVTVVPRHGARVLPVSSTDMREIYAILTSLESTAAELVAQRGLSSDALQPLEEATAAMDDALNRDDLKAWAAADERFHACLLDLCGNRLLKGVVLNFWDRAHRARMVTLRLRPKPYDSTHEHSELVDAIRRGDAAAARDMQRAHRERAGTELLKLLELLGLDRL